jgi:hypothetical protein
MEVELISETLVTIYGAILFPLYSQGGITTFLRKAVNDLPDYTVPSKKTADQMYVVTAVRNLISRIQEISRCHKSEDHNLNVRRHENLKSHLQYCLHNQPIS